jgi:hypothetical protein
LPGEASHANQPQVPGGAGGDPAAGISGHFSFNHVWPLVAGGGGMSDFWKDCEPEPHKGLSEHMAQVTNGRVRIDPVTGDVGIGTPPAQPAPVQATMKLESSGPGHGPAPKQKLSVRHVSLIDEGKTAAQLAVPDVLNPKDENPAYAAGWNDCRAEMLKGMRP